MDSGTLTNLILSSLLQKIRVPSEYHAQCEELRNLLSDDVTGLVGSLTGFGINSASVDYSFETVNDNLTNKLNSWLEEVNIGFGGQVPTGIMALAKEYFKERWQASSFPVLKLHKWERVGDLVLPTEMYFLDGESIYAEDKNEDDKDLSLVNYTYFIGSKKESKYEIKSTKNHDYIMSKPYARWFDKYPVPYLIKNGVYHNYRIIESLKNKESEVLDQILPYLLLIKKGSPELFQQGKTISQPQLNEVIEQFQELMTEIKTASSGIKTPIRATDFTEEIKHLIPNLTDIFDEKLFSVAEKNILSALGFIDIAEAISSSRAESILNPTVFLEEVRQGVKDFKDLLNEVYLRIKKRNPNSIKYMNSEVHIINSPVTSLMTNAIRELLRQQYDRGNLSRQTAVEILGASFATEKLRREKEQKGGDDYILYPPIVQNQEQHANDPSGQGNPDKDDEEIPDVKKNPVEKKNFNNATIVRSECPYCSEVIEYDEGLEKSDKKFAICIECGNEIFAKDLAKRRTNKKSKSYNLEGAPYSRIVELPDNVKKRLSPKKQRQWMNVFNSIYDTILKKTGNKKTAEQRAFSGAWTAVK